MSPQCAWCAVCRRWRITALTAEKPVPGRPRRQKVRVVRTHSGPVKGPMCAGSQRRVLSEEVLR